MEETVEQWLDQVEEIGSEENIARVRQWLLDAMEAPLEHSEVIEALHSLLAGDPEKLKFLVMSSNWQESFRNNFNV